MQPIVARPYNFKMKSSLAKRGQFPIEISDQYLAATIKPNSSTLPSFIRAEKIKDPSQCQRLRVLEYIFGLMELGTDPLVVAN
jgi:hypothetical protein